MRILILTASYPPVLGGLQTAVHALARGLKHRLHDVLVVTNHYPGTLERSECVDGIPVIRLPFIVPRRHHFVHRPDLLIRGLISFPVVKQHLHKLIERFQPDIVNLHFPDRQIPFVLSLRHKLQFQLIASLHGDEVLRYTSAAATCGHEIKPAAEAEALRTLLLEADAVTACSQYLLDCASYLEPAVIRKGFVIHNGVDSARFNDLTPQMRSRPYVLAYGRLTHKKGFDILLEAFAQLGPKYADIDLVLAGAGEERPALEEQARRLGITERVEFYGRATPQEVLRLLNGCVLLAVPSRQEPFGIVALEGMAAGKLVIAASVGGLPEIVARPPNLLVEPCVEQIRQAIALSLDQRMPEESIGAQNRGYAQRYTWDLMIERFLQVYQECRFQLDNNIDRL